MQEVQTRNTRPLLRNFRLHDIVTRAKAWWKMFDAEIEKEEAVSVEEAAHTVAQIAPIVSHFILCRVCGDQNARAAEPLPFLHFGAHIQHRKGPNYRRHQDRHGKGGGAFHSHRRSQATVERGQRTFGAGLPGPNGYGERLPL